MATPPGLVRPTSTATAGVAVVGGRKRPFSAMAPGVAVAADEASELQSLELTPLGGGNEVGRSCLLLRYKGKTIMLDCGVLPSFTGQKALPYLDEIDPATVDIIIITHFHLDHCGALPHFTERMEGFRGRIFATHPTIAVMKMLLQDYTRVSTLVEAADPDALFDDRDIDRCIARMEAVDFHQRITCGGVVLTFYAAGHVLGAAMVALEIGGVRVLYTGDYSCEEDRHLCAAEVPRGPRPDLLIVEATHGLTALETREARERRFTEAVEATVKRGGRCLIPVFALGHAQELMLVMDEFWAARPDLQGVPIYYANRLAHKGLEVYRTFVGHCNARLQRESVAHNPWNFRHIRHIRGADDFRDAPGVPCVVFASPGMLQSGFSRALFDRWCEDARNGVVLVDFSTEGTLAKALEANPSVVESAARRLMARRLVVYRVSFSSHADSPQTAAFIEALRPPAIVLVHGERTGMRKLLQALARRYDGLVPGFSVHMPPNTTTVALPYEDDRLVKLMGAVAARRLAAGAKVAGVLLRRNLTHLLLAPADLPRFTDLAAHTLAQRLHVPYRAGYGLLKAFVTAMFPHTAELIPPQEPLALTAVLPPAVVPSAAAAKDEVGAAGAPPPPPPPPLRPHQLPHAGKVLVVGDPAATSASAAAAAAVALTFQPPDRVVVEWAAGPAADTVADALVALIGQAEVSQASVKAIGRAGGGCSGHGQPPHDGPHDGCGHSSGDGSGDAHTHGAHDHSSDGCHNGRNVRPRVDDEDVGGAGRAAAAAAAAVAAVVDAPGSCSAVPCSEPPAADESLPMAPIAAQATTTTAVAHLPGWQQWLLSRDSADLSDLTTGERAALQAATSAALQSRFGAVATPAEPYVSAAGYSRITIEEVGEDEEIAAGIGDSGTAAVQVPTGEHEAEVEDEEDTEWDSGEGAALAASLARQLTQLPAPLVRRLLALVATLRERYTAAAVTVTVSAAAVVSVAAVSGSAEEVVCTVRLEVSRDIEAWWDEEEPEAEQDGAGEAGASATTAVARVVEPESPVVVTLQCVATAAAGLGLGRFRFRVLRGSDGTAAVDVPAVTTALVDGAATVSLAARPPLDAGDAESNLAADVERAVRAASFAF